MRLRIKNKRDYSINERFWYEVILPIQQVATEDQIEKLEQVELIDDCISFHGLDSKEVLVLFESAIDKIRSIPDKYLSKKDKKLRVWFFQDLINQCT